MRGGPADIGIYIVQTDGRSWPFIEVGTGAREVQRPIFDVFGAIHGLYALWDVYLVHFYG
jgi:hypothetical protein